MQTPAHRGRCWRQLDLAGLRAEDDRRPGEWLAAVLAVRGPRQVRRRSPRQRVLAPDGSTRTQPGRCYRSTNPAVLRDNPRSQLWRAPRPSLISGHGSLASAAGAEIGVEGDAVSTPRGFSGCGEFPALFTTRAMRSRRRALSASLSGARHGLVPTRKGQEGHPTAVHLRTSSLRGCWRLTARRGRSPDDATDRRTRPFCGIIPARSSGERRDPR